MPTYMNEVGSEISEQQYVDISYALSAGTSWHPYSLTFTLNGPNLQNILSSLYYCLSMGKI